MTNDQSSMTNYQLSGAFGSVTGHWTSGIENLKLKIWL
jgi:hypothetical protein